MSTMLKLVEQTKECRACFKNLPLFSFSKNLAAKDGLQYKCRPCDIDYQKQRRENNKEAVLEYGRAYQKNRRKNFEYRLQMLLNASKQRAKLKNREHSITLEDIKDLYPVDGKCPVFGFNLEFNDAGFRETSPSIDRIDSDKGYTKDNIQIISWKANRLKAYATVEDLEILVAFLKQGE
jgi:predicted MPP superfamily phosphohydrolase